MKRGIWPEQSTNPMQVRMPCGCVVDRLTGAMERPCVLHEGEGHLSAVSADPETGAVTSRCLRRDCRWTVTYWAERQAVSAAQEHWTDTRTASG